MTNGEKLISDFPYIKVEGQDEVFTAIQIDTTGTGTLIAIYTEWWNAEYKATKNDLALINTEGLYEDIRCTMCTNSMANDRGCDGSCVVNNAMYKKVMDVIENHIVDINKMVEPTTKNDLGVDCISRQEVLNTAKASKSNWIDNSILFKRVNKLPSITPQEPRKGHWIGNYQVDFGEWQEYDVKLSDGFVTDNCHCSECGEELLSGDRGMFCPYCGADMREVKG